MQDDKGHFFRVGQDGSLFFPIIELSCGNTDYIPEKNYFYNLETGANDSVNI